MSGKLKMQQIQVLYNAEQKMEALYGLDMFGDVYWYRDAQYNVDKEKFIRTAGWVKLEMSLSELVEEKLEEQKDEDSKPAENRS